MVDGHGGRLPAPNRPSALNPPICLAADAMFLQVVEFMRERYCGSMAVEYTHLSDRFQRSWIKTIFESDDHYDKVKARDKGSAQDTKASSMQGHDAHAIPPSHRRSRWLGGLSDDDRKEVLETLVRVDHLERFLGNKFPAVKRFGIEGAEAVLPGLHWLIRSAALQGVEGVELGMAHRGRLNVLVNLFGKPLGAICNEFTESDLSVADVKYHLGVSCHVTLFEHEEIA